MFYKRENIRRPVNYYMLSKGLVFQRGHNTEADGWIRF